MDVCLLREEEQRDGRKKEERRRGTAYSVQNNLPKSNQIELKHTASHIHIQRRTDTQHRPQAWTVYTLIRPPMCRIKLKVVVSYWLRRVLLTFIYLLACLHVNKRSVLSTNPCIWSVTGQENRIGGPYAFNIEVLTSQCGQTQLDVRMLNHSGWLSNFVCLRKNNRLFQPALSTDNQSRTDTHPLFNRTGHVHIHGYRVNLSTYRDSLSWCLKVVTPEHNSQRRRCQPCSHFSLSLPS